MYSREKLERLLRQAKVTTQSIQKVSQWMLTHRQNLSEMVKLWSDLIREGEAEHQIVYLYVANDAMQVGLRKFGRHITTAFEKELVEIFQLVMQDGKEKVKRCAIKIVGIWKERAVISPPLLAMLESVCAGSPPVEDASESDEKLEESKAKVLLEMTADASIDHVLEDMPEVVESSCTTQLATRLQDLVNATISADMLSDRMFQLESSISVFHHACGDVDETEEDDTVLDTGEHINSFPSAGGIVWSKMDQQVYDLDLDNSRGHVEQYRINLTNQATKREVLIETLKNLQARDSLSISPSSTTLEEADQQERALEKLYASACEAESLELKQLEEQRAEFRARQELLAASAMDPLFSGYQPHKDFYSSNSATLLVHGQRDGGKILQGHRLSYREYDQTQQPSLRRHSSALVVTHRDGMRDRYNDYRDSKRNERYEESSSRNGVDSPSTVKRPKLNHPHTVDFQVGLSQGGRSTNSYAAVKKQQMPFLPRDNRYPPSRDHYQAPPPRQGRRTRWDSMPADRYSNFKQEERRW
ncbi:putative CID domain-containing protein [Plasmopara halstedii]